MSKTALITGATSGLGLSYARYFASKGCNLIITGRREDIIRENAESLQNQFHVNVEVIIAELSSLDGINRFLAQIGDRTIDILVNNAGFGLKPSFVDTPETDVEKMLYLQVWCVTKLTQFILKGMVRRNSGAIINISSDGAFAVLPHNVLYSSTKLYIINFTEGLHMELSGTDIRVQAVCPGFIDSHFHESAEMHMDKSRKGLFGFRDPDAIVADAMKDFAKKKVISVPDTGAKMIRTLVRFLPRNLFYRMAARFSSSLSGKK